MAKIQVLDSHVADLIAAGEVVERPASVVKELMENAIDAGASAVTVEISHGGMTFIRVTDDGKGIPADELATAFLRHATSKLRTEYDLEAIGTLGFRGEALAAISAVSRVDVLTRTVDAPFGASISLEGGIPGPVEEAGCPLGTTMVVRDLFFNTPARLKFMKKDTAEGAAVFGVVQRVALSHPEVSVKFIRDGKQELLTPGDSQLQSAVYAVLGRELALGFRPVKASGEDVTVSGFVSLPACCRPSRTWQFFFVNGRQVKSSLLMAALEEAYKNQKMVGKFPGCVLHLEMKLSTVDVNVHPAKTEVKFGSERQVFTAVYHAVLSALNGDTSHPSFVRRDGERLEPRTERIAQMPTLDVVTPNQTRLTIPAQNTAVRVQDTTFRAAAVPAFRPSPILDQPNAGTVKESPSESVRPGVSVTPSPQGKTQPFVIREPSSTPAAQPPTPQQKRQVPTAPASPPPTTIEKAPPAPSALEASWHMAGEVLNTYIIVEQGDQIFFIDKHAAHERMNFDRMKAEGYDPMAQTLLSPVICRLSAQEQEALLSQLPLLEKFGFDVDELGGGLAVRQAPFDVEVGDIEATLAEIARNLLTTGGADPSAARDELLHTMACKAAMKGGWKTSPQELERVVTAVMTGAVKYCPHGRPVAIELTRKELEKQFKRT